MNGYPEEIDILLKGCGPIAFQMGISAEEVEINWGGGDILTHPKKGWMSAEHEFNTKEEFVVRVKGKRIVGLNVSRLNLIALSLHCPDLEYLDCSVNELSRLDLACCPALEELYCNSNNISDLLFSRQPRLVQANVSYNRLESLDVSGCTSLKALYGSGNRLSRVRLNVESPLSYLDLGNNLLDRNALNSIFRHFAPKQGKGVIHYMQNPGTDECDVSLLNTKVYL